MTVKIVLPDREGVKAGWGTKVFNSDGGEIEDVTKIELKIEPDDIIKATITVAVDEVENLNGIQPLVPDMPIDFIEAEVKKHGYKLVKDE